MSVAEPLDAPHGGRALADVGRHRAVEPRRWSRLDIGLAAAVVVGMVVSLGGPAEVSAQAAAATALIGVAVAFRDRAPVLVPVALFVALMVGQFRTFAASGLAATVMVWSLMVIASEGRLLATAMGSALYAAVLTSATAAGLDARSTLLFGIQGLVLIVAMLRFAADERAGHEAERRATIEAADAELRLRRAQELDRQRISLELHGIVSEAMQQVRASTARADTVADADLVPALTRAEEASRSALAELRRMVRVLRTPDDTALAERRPQPGVADVEQLLRAAAPRASIVVDVDEHDWAPTLSMAVYRLVEDALEVLRGPEESTLSHARVATDGEGVVVRMSGSDVGAAEMRLGYPNTVAMRERVHLVGGHVEITPGEGGDGVLIDARFPIAPR